MLRQFSWAGETQDRESWRRLISVSCCSLLWAQLSSNTAEPVQRGFVAANPNLILIWKTICREIIIPLIPQSCSGILRDQHWDFGLFCPFLTPIPVFYWLQNLTTQGFYQEPPPFIAATFPTILRYCINLDFQWVFLPQESFLVLFPSPQAWRPSWVPSSSLWRSCRTWWSWQFSVSVSLPSLGSSCSWAI